MSDDNGKSDMEENTNVDKEVNKDEDYIHTDMDMDMEDDHVKVAPKLTMEEKRAMRLLVVTQEEIWITVKVCYVIELMSQMKVTGLISLQN